MCVCVCIYINVVSEEKVKCCRLVKICFKKIFSSEFRFAIDLRISYQLDLKPTDINRYISLIKNRCWVRNFPEKLFIEHEDENNLSLHKHSPK